MYFDDNITDYQVFIDIELSIFNLLRYASWKSTQQMSDTPELVLNGSYVEKDNTFLFSKGRKFFLWNTYPIIHDRKINLTHYICDSDK